MNKFLVIVYFIGAFSFTTRTEACDQELVYYFQGESPPYQAKEDDGSLSGFDFEMLDTIASRAGCSIKVVDKKIPWARRLRMLEQGEPDVVATASYKDDRAKYAWFELPYRHESLALFVRAGEQEAFGVAEAADLLDSKMVLGIQNGSTYGPDTDELIERIKSASSKRIHALSGKYSYVRDRFRELLLKGRIDGYLSYPASEAKWLKKKGLEDQIVAHQMRFVNTGPLYFMMSRKSVTQENIESMAAVLDDMKSDGTVESLIVKYSEKYGVARGYFE